MSRGSVEKSFACLARRGASLLFAFLLLVPSLPAFQFSNDSYDAETPSLERQMKDCFSQPNNADVAQCIAQYGAGLNGNGPSLDFGIQRLCKHFDTICRNFSDNPYVFAVIVDKVRNDNVEERSGVADDVLTKIQVNKLLTELREKIPLTYLHIPISFEFLVHNHRVVFEYWQSASMLGFLRFCIPLDEMLSDLPFLLFHPELGRAYGRIHSLHNKCGNYITFR